MSDGSEQLTINIQGREYRIKCPVQHKAELISAAKQLDEAAEKFRCKHRFSSLDQVMVLVALNLICDQTALSNKSTELSRLWQLERQDVVSRLRKMNAQLDQTLNNAGSISNQPINDG